MNFISAILFKKKTAIIPNNTKSLVPMAYYEMFGLRLIGFTYRQIAEKVDYSESHVKRLFAEGGILHKVWEDWLIKAKKNCVDESIAIMFGHLPDIVRARVIHAKKFDVGAIVSSKMIFEYTLGRPEEFFKRQEGWRIYTVADLIREATLGEKREQELINKAESDTNVGI